MKGLFSAFMLFLYFVATAMPPLPVCYLSDEFEGMNSEQESYNDLYDYTQILVDSSGAWTYEEVLHKSDQFKPNNTRSD